MDLILRSFVLLSFTVCYKAFSILPDQQYPPDNFRGMAYFLNFTGDPVKWIIAFFFMFLISGLLTLLNPNRTKVAVYSLSFMVLQAISSNRIYKVDGNTHALVYVLLLFLFLSYEKSEKNFEHNEKITDIAQTVPLAIYFTSGLWKLRSMIEYGHVSKYILGSLDNIAASAIKDRGLTDRIIDNISFFEPVIVGGFVFVLLFQLLAPLAIFNKKWRPYWGVMAVIFHTSTGIFMGIWFYEMMYLSVFLLIFVPYLRGNFMEA